MLHDELVALERRCLAEAPQLVEQVRKLLARVSAANADAPTMIHSLEPQPLAEPVPSSMVPGPERYDDLGPIATGGMGQVRRVRDLTLNRVLAMKVILPELAGQMVALARFGEEAQATAQLEHPGIVPVYEMGSLPDGRLFFTMREVHGRRFTEAIEEAHRGPPAERAVALRRLVSVLLRVSQAVAYAHERGVVHRDLKPDNVMLGDFGEVLVMDWGLAKVMGTIEAPSEEHDHEVVVTDRALDDALATRMGTVAGTPAYMAPEQARGELDRITPRSDVYALGVMLYEVLSGQRPYEGPSGHHVLQQVLAGPPRSVGQGLFGDENDTFTFNATDHTAEARLLPDDLVAACERAMARSPDDRFATAKDFAVELESWLDGSRRREQALAVVAKADATRPEAEALLNEALGLEGEANALLDALPAWAPEADKAPAWAKLEASQERAQQAHLKQVEREQLLQAALTHVPDLTEAHEALVAEYRQRHEAAERAGRTTERLAAEVQLQRHVLALPEDYAVRDNATRYLRGDGALTLVTEPPGAEVTLTRYVRHHQRLVEEEVESLGRTPIIGRGLPMGSYLCVLRREGHQDVRYPVQVERTAHWSGVDPGGMAPLPILLPVAGSLGADDCYVPAGWFRAGDPAERVWCDAFVMKRFAVTNQQFIAFLDDLAAAGRQDEALHWVPREMASRPGELGAMIYGRDGDRFVLVEDADGDRWEPDWPVLHVSWQGAMAYAGWRALHDRVPWRLPSEWEWEKAARGVDGRRFPWGDGSDPSFACYFHSHSGSPLPKDVRGYPLDQSPYGVRGLCGNTREFCLEEWGPVPDRHERVSVSRKRRDPEANMVTRGNAWSDGSLEPAFHRHVAKGGLGYFSRGFRLVASLHP